MTFEPLRGILARMAYEVWTKRCPSTLTHLGDDAHRPYIPDEADECDACLLESVGLLAKGRGLPGCEDPLGMETVYREDDVVEALRKLKRGDQ